MPPTRDGPRRYTSAHDCRIVPQLRQTTFQRRSTTALPQITHDSLATPSG